MRSRTRNAVSVRAASVGAAAFVLAGSAALVAPSTAVAAEPLIVGSCGSSAQGTVGQPLELRLPLLPPINFGVIQQGTTTLTKKVPVVGGLVDSLCKITVTGVNAVAAPVQDATKPVTDTARGVVNGVGERLAPRAPAPGPQQPPGNGPGPQQPAPRPGQGPLPGQQQGGPAAENGGFPGLLAPNSPVLGGGAGLPGFAALPTNFSSGFAPMRDYSNLPAATAGLFAPSPGLRYGGQVPGYNPQFGVLDPNRAKPPAGDNGVQNAGQAEALPEIDGGGPLTDGVGLPVLLAVLALSGVSAALVRTWVLRRANGLPA